MPRRSGVPIALLAACAAAATAGGGAHAAHVCNVLDYGAVGDNTTEDTAALAKAIADCAGSGDDTGDGGITLLPGNHTFLLRPVQLPSHSVLRIDGNISAWPDLDSWPNSTVRQCATTPYETPLPQVVLAPQKEALLWSANSTNVTITGNGVVDGGGWRWWPKRLLPGDYWHNCRPSLLSFGRRWPMPLSGVSESLVEGITLKDSPFWTIQGRGLSGVRFDNVKVTTTGCGYAEAPNTDGFNLQGDNIEVLNSQVRNGDDCVPLFPPTRNVTVRNITCSCGNGLVPVTWPSLSIPGGGGDITDVLFEDARFDHTNMAIAVKSLPSFNGTVSNVTYRNMQLTDVGQAIMINVFNQGGDAATGDSLGARSGGGGGGHRVGMSTVRKVLIENVTGSAQAPGKITCAPGALACQDIELRGVNVTVLGPNRKYECENVNGTEEDCEPPSCFAAP